MKKFILAISILAFSITALTALSLPGVGTIQSQAKFGEIEKSEKREIKPPKPDPAPDTRVIDWIKILRDYLGDLLVTDKEPQLRDGQSVIVVKQKRDKSTYIVLTPEQATKISENVVKFNELTSQALGLKIKVTITISYPPLKIVIKIEL